MGSRQTSLHCGHPPERLEPDVSAAAARVRNIFRQRHSRRHQAHNFRWPHLPSTSATPLACCDSTPSQPEDFHWLVVTGFSDLLEPPRAAGASDTPVSFSELRQGLSRCAESSVVGYSTLSCIGPVSLSIVVLIFICGDPSMPDNHRPVSLACCCLKCLERVVHAWIAVHFSNLVDPSGGEQMPWLGSFVDVLQTRCSTHMCVVSRTSRRRLTGLEWTPLWFSSTRQESQGSCGLSLPIFSVTRSPRCELGALLSEPWEDTGIA